MNYRLPHWILNQDLSRMTTDEIVKKAQDWLHPLTDQDVIELLMTGFIPDMYEENREEEKVFTKLMEVLVAECFSRIGFHSTVVKTKNESEDVRITSENRSILVDAKTYRLGRSQIAPNVKDFVKLHTIDEWIKNYNKSNQTKAIGGLVVYPSTHEWVRQSQVYKECSNKKTPIVMLSYEILAFLLQNKQSFEPSNLFSLWHFEFHFPQVVHTRQQYWNAMIPAIANAIRVSPEEMMNELEVFQLYYTEAIEEAQEGLSSKIQSISQQIPQQVQNMSEETVRSLLKKLLIQSETSPLENSIENIQKKRKEFLPA